MLATGAALCACSTVAHRAGDTSFETRAHYGVPVLDRSFFWYGKGESDNAGASLFASRYVTDAFALGAGATVANWFVGGDDAQSVEACVGGRVYPFDSLPLFWQGTGGFMQATDNIPPGGTEWNFTFSFGPGLELPIRDHEALVFGVDYHHTSNALGRDSERNPSQNEARLWAGWSWTF